MSSHESDRNRIQLYTGCHGKETTNYSLTCFRTIYKFSQLLTCEHFSGNFGSPTEVGALFTTVNAILDTNHNANPTNPNRYSKGNPNPTNPNTRYRCE